MRAWVRPRRATSAHLLSIIAIVLALTAPAGAALVTARGIANNAIESRHIRNGRITSADLAPRSVTNRQIALGTIKAPNLANGSIGTNQVADGSLTGADLVDGSVTVFDLAPGTVGASSLANGSIGTALLADGGVSTSDLADGAVTSGKIAPGAVTGSKLGDSSVTTGKINDGAVTSSKFAIGAVQAQHIGAGEVRGAALGKAIAAGVEATVANVPNDVAVPNDETDGAVVPFSVTFDTASIWSPASPNDLTLPLDGLYLVTVWVDWDPSDTGYREAQIVHDGTVVAQDRRDASADPTAERSNQTLGTLVNGVVGDVVRVRLSQASGGSLGARVRLTIHRVGAVS